MRRVSLFLDTTILEQSIKENSSLHGPTMRLLNYCLTHFEGYTSILAIHELLNHYSEVEAEQILKILHAHQIKLLWFTAPKEVDYFALNIKNRDKLKLRSEYDLYNLSAYCVTSIENYVTWNISGLEKFVL